jgi:hypothetical protein
MAVHIQYEWIWVLYQAQYAFAIMIGIIAGMMRARVTERRELRRRRAAEMLETNIASVPCPVA